jgi:hypothetical protein
MTFQLAMTAKRQGQHKLQLPAWIVEWTIVLGKVKVVVAVLQSLHLSQN